MLKKGPSNAVHIVFFFASHSAEHEYDLLNLWSWSNFLVTLFISDRGNSLTIMSSMYDLES